MMLLKTYISEHNYQKKSCSMGNKRVESGNKMKILLLLIIL